MKNNHLLKKVFAGVMIASVAAVSLAGCGSSSDNSSGSASSKALDANFEFAKGKVSDYSSSQTRMSGIFSDKVFSTANAAAMMINAKSTKEDLEKIARYLFLDSISVVDEKGDITACYPETEKGKNLKNLKDKQLFNRVVKGIVVKTMTDPVPVEGSSEYIVTAGVSRADGVAGAVIVSYKTDDYDDVTGKNLADKCGANTIVVYENAVLSSTLEQAKEGDPTDMLGVSADSIEKGSFSMKVDNASYNCKSVVIDDYTLICAEPK